MASEAFVVKLPMMHVSYAKSVLHKIVHRIPVVRNHIHRLPSGKCDHESRKSDKCYSL